MQAYYPAVAMSLLGTAEKNFCGTGGFVQRFVAVTGRTPCCGKNRIVLAAAHAARCNDQQYEQRPKRT